MSSAAGPLQGGVATVIGGAGTGAGLGAGLVRQLAREGMKVAVVDLDHEAALKLAAELRSFGATAIAVAADITDPAAVAAAAAAVREQLGGCNILCVHVGGGGQGALEHLTADDLRAALELNVVAPLGAVQAFLPLIRETAGPRRIVVTSSAAALAPGRFQGAYRAAKTAVTSLAETLDLELGPEGIGATVIFPSGMLPAAMLEGLELPMPTENPVLEDGSIDIGSAIFAEMASLPSDLASGDDAAQPVIDAIKAGDRYVVTHGESVARVYADRAVVLDGAVTALRNRDYRAVSAVTAASDS